MFIQSMTKDRLEKLSREIDNPEAVEMIKEMKKSYIELKNGEERIHKDHLELRPDFYSLAWLYTFKTEYIHGI